ncbi:MULTISPECIES: ParB/RepB/Spo0J family partition protein [Legionella]|uniref:Probable chromosome-partitioning protein ParB n=1 Tax=Legionella septentrionalis TaxID=2498109 RepID=A0A433JLI6_9GAMM|nr:MULTISPECIES: ParB/RepB/Spo0J family partition protein [Legionella]MCP0913979.1 ParB/RepB/Spo0J family partition protein [Legionella sp. 27cVA30]RUQ90364.1 ParB/RepB/Spo0J family partition protein [Legionella septentrionalis]RUR00015.1 ParB/RepB/Spo0J family partition protein [Legionella septentrionalis]RUR10711.1 ParB/RepB/Spo0J family partition protein [Legionella septentrionalis]RUR16536.1 ParB/RepB/Spo0J family partition protein [Legionella septentrionalis]
MQTLKWLPIEFLQRGRYQPRKAFAEDALQELAQSILSQGLIEPLIVRQNTPDCYEIIAGERRWRAAMLAGLTEVPCLIGEYGEEQAAAITLIENIQRQDLNLMEEAHGYRRLSQEFHFNQEEIATLVGKSRSHIANILRLLTLAPSLQERIANKQLSLGHARALVGLTIAEQEMLAGKIEAHGWSVRHLEKKVQDLKARNSASPNGAETPDKVFLEMQLAEQIGAPVQIVPEDGGGWLKIKFYDNDTLSGLLERMGLRYD